MRAGQEEPGTAPMGTPHILQMASTPGLPATPGTVPITPGTAQLPQTVATPAVDLPGTIPAATPGTMLGGVATPGTMLGGGFASTAMTPGSAPVGRTPGTYVTPGAALADLDLGAAKAASYKNYVGAVVRPRCSLLTCLVATTGRSVLLAWWVSVWSLRPRGVRASASLDAPFSWV